MSLPEDPEQNGMPQRGSVPEGDLPVPQGPVYPAQPVYPQQPLPAPPYDPSQVVPPPPGPASPGYPPQPGYYDPNQPGYPPQPGYYADPNQQPYSYDPAVGPNPMGLVDERGYPVGYAPPPHQPMSRGLKGVLIGCGSAAAIGLIGVFAFVIVIFGPCIGLNTF